MWKEQLLLLALLAALLLPASSQAQSHLFEDDDIDDDCHLKTSIVLHKLDNCEREKSNNDLKRNHLLTDVIKETIDATMKQHQKEIKSQLDQLTNKLVEVQSQTIKVEATLELVKTQVQENANLIQLPECQRWLQTRNLDRTKFFSVEGKYFYYDITSGNWSKTHEWCAERGMQMAMLKTQTQIGAVVKESKKHGKTDSWYWLGASDVGQPAGQFQWVDGTLVDGATWLTGTIYKYHGDLNERTCVELYTGNARLSDRRCSGAGPKTLCQVPSALVACL